MDFPSGGAPVAGTAGGGVEGLRSVLGIKEEPAANADPAALKVIAERAGGPALALLRGEDAHARGDLDDDATIFGGAHRIKNKLDVRVSFGRIRGVAIDGFDAADVDIPDVASDFCAELVVPAVAVVSRLEERVESDARIYLLRFRSGVAIFEEIEVADGRAGSVALHRAAVEDFEVGARSDVRGRWAMTPEPIGDESENEK